MPVKILWSLGKVSEALLMTKTISIDVLKNRQEAIPHLASIWHEAIGKVWAPDVSIESAIERFNQHLQENTLPLTLVALDGNKPIGMCSLRSNDGIRPDLTPWLGSLVVDPNHQKQGVGQQLIEAIKQKAKSLGYPTLYLFAFDQTIPNYYTRLGWLKIGMDLCKNIPVTVMSIDLY